MSIALIIGLGVLVLIAAIAVSQRSGPRVTRIETRRELTDEEDGK
ncbi:MAG TPA: hypothetical protein VFR52_00495 [Sphingomicrobium sp.]|nr:hypothetical protein [Sphingomicrobium sp.]